MRAVSCGCPVRYLQVVPGCSVFPVTGSAPILQVRRPAFGLSRRFPFRVRPSRLPVPVRLKPSLLRLLPQRPEQQPGPLLRLSLLRLPWLLRPLRHRRSANGRFRRPVPALRRCNRCRVAGGLRLRRASPCASAGLTMPPTPMIGKLPPERVWMRRTTSTARWVSGCAAQAAAADLVERHVARMQPFAAVGAVGGHDAVERCFEQDVADFVDDFVRHVGRHLEHDRPVLVLPAAEVEQRIKYLEICACVCRWCLRGRSCRN